MLKILQVGKYYHPYKGGIETITKELAEGIVAKGLQCTVLVFNNKLIMEEIVHGNLKVIKSSSLFKISSMPFSYSFYWQLKREIKKHDVIHVHLPDPLVVFYLLLLKNDKPLVIHWHSDIIKQKLLKLIYLPFEKIFLKTAKSIVATSSNYPIKSKQLNKYLDKIEIIPLGINTSKLKIDMEVYTRLRNQFENNRIILSVGRLVGYKGFKYLIEALRFLPKNYHLIIIGNGPLEKNLLSLSKKFKVADRLHIISGLNDYQLASYYQLADVFCLSSISRAEAFGIVQLEAMSFSKPLVTTNIVGSGVGSININKETGIVVKIKDPLALANAISLIIEDSFLYNKYSNTAKDIFMQNFQIDTMVDRFINLYYKLVELN